MAGTILITGANGSLAVTVITRLLQTYPSYTLLLTVRNSSDTDVNTAHLRSIIKSAGGSNTEVRIEELDLSSLASVAKFAERTAAEIASGKLPRLTSIVCNAFYWNLASGIEYSDDGIEKTFQVNHLAHAALVLRLLGSFAPDGRVVMLASDAHWPGKNSLEKYPPDIPKNLDILLHPHADDPKDNILGKGVQRYGSSKLAVVMWMYALNRRLEKNPNLGSMTAIAINPGNLSDSRALRVNTPKVLQYMSRFMIQPMRPVLRLMDPTMRTAQEAGHDIAELATNTAFPGVRGYFTLLKQDESSPDSKNEDVQETIWKKTLEWTGINEEETGLKSAL